MTTKWETTLDDELSVLADKWTTDKLRWYTSFYHSILKDRRDAKKVLEIGIGHTDCMWGPHNWKLWPVAPYITGASVRMWEEYFPQAKIYAMDIKRDILFDKGRIKSLWFDQAIESTYPLDDLGTDFDLIVEDGSHQLEHQMLAMKTLVPIVRPGGLYIMEDMGHLNHEGLLKVCEQIPYPHELVEFHNPRLPNDFAAVIVIRP